MALSPVCHRTENLLLSALPVHEFKRIAPVLRPVHFALGDIVYEPNTRLAHLYFPTSVVVSLLYTMTNGSTAEMGMTGNDGVVGIPLFLGGGSTPNRAVAQIAGDACAISTKELEYALVGGSALWRILLRYTQALLTQVSQTAVCNRLHTVEQRLSRWLLLCHDRTRSNDLLMTQEFIGNMLGGRRESVTVAAGQLQDAGLIRYSRGHIRILKRRGLEDIACECYSVVKRECDRIFDPASGWSV